jgi:hypothetical protein
MNATDLLSYPRALDAAKDGRMIARASWENTGDFVFARPHDDLPVDFIPKVKSLPEEVKEVLAKRETETIPFSSYLCRYTSKAGVQNGWNPGYDDMTAKDWVVIVPLTPEEDPLCPVCLIITSREELATFSGVCEDCNTEF